MGYLDKILNIGIEYNKEIPLGVFASPEGEIELTAEFATQVAKPSAEAYNIEIGIDNSGNLTLGCQNQITEISTELDLNGINEADAFGEILSNIALSVKSGNITFEISEVTSYYAEFSIAVSTENLMPDDSKLEAAISVTLHFKISLNGNGDKQFNTAEFAQLAKVGVVVVVAVVAICFLLPEGILSSIFAAFVRIGGLILS